MGPQSGRSGVRVYKDGWSVGGRRSVGGAADRLGSARLGSTRLSSAQFLFFVVVVVVFVVFFRIAEGICDLPSLDAFCLATFGPYF